MKSISINPRQFQEAKSRADWFNDPSAVRDWDNTFSVIVKLGYSQVKYQIGLRDTFQGDEELWARRIDPILKYCAVYKMNLLLVIDDIPACLSQWGMKGTIERLQKVISRVGSRARYTFGELNPEDWESIVNTYTELVNGLDFLGNELQSPPMLVSPFIPWQRALAMFLTTPLAGRCNVIGVNIYVDRRYSSDFIDAYQKLLAQSKTILATSRKQYVIHETGLSPNYAQVDDIERGEMLIGVERMIYRIGGFRDYGICCANDPIGTPSDSQFSILNPNLILGYLRASGYALTIDIPSKNTP